MGFTFFLALICILNLNQFLKAENLDVYIVHVDPAQSDNLETFYDSFLPTNTNLEADSAVIDQPRILHRYRNVFSGFAAKLSAAEVEAMRQKKGFVSARPERMLPLHTTHSPSFLGLSQNTGLWENSNYGKGVIIGVLDTGITPEHPSFSDEGMPPPPARWKGKCQLRVRGSCNNKLIGARYYFGKSPIDVDGHGTHTAGTAAGNFVGGAALFGNANGTAAGIAPHAHVAIYQACQPEGCPESAIAAAMDAAIDDGVDVLSMSLGGGFAPYPNDVIAIGAYRAMQRGIVVSCSAGNEGPDSETLTNQAPWIMTVGASTTDRKILVTASLGNGEKIHGETAKGFHSIKKKKLVHPRSNLTGTTYCDTDFGIDDVRGKIVMCDGGGAKSRTEKAEAVKSAGGAAIILVNDELAGDTTMVGVYPLPAIQIGYTDGLKIQAYLNSTSKPKATIAFKGTVLGDNRAPVVAPFSSRGPNIASPGILKPDIIGPGFNILAAWPNSIFPNTTFYMISGTSMSCPHLSGVAALLKSAHPDWSPAVIKSAIMTTADFTNRAGNPIENDKMQPAELFAIGSGHVNPTQANDPGLVYDISPDDYIPYLCGMNFTDKEVSVVVQRNVDCSDVNSIIDSQLNYPSFSIILGSTPQSYTRTVTNVGKANASFDVEIVSPDGVIVRVEPERLWFWELGQKLSYNVTFTRSAADGATKKNGEGFIKWNSADHSVRSPISVVFV
ncbi:hypothetical protein MIMGU_mgv1a026567mg [Erythranthe guttata]|uniref:Uncharacterized protein n=1 Tax=Erythranthe guttata TaxID=4155 RepID=A0A022QN37_ERYGU|nr:PREDICTED: subtilisin-like protease SBT1.2 [Erythranthe guttata]EYU29361.1 hypothetical protein MIMGU_mgv1a026567mg [Erythranthe guttata]|eukprot:XP_012846977.1 PREDICTED: subtilisin-like protease SBT1.2 [Erythranthe guttata]